MWPARVFREETTARELAYDLCLICFRIKVEEAGWLSLSITITSMRRNRKWILLIFMSYPVSLQLAKLPFIK